MDGKIPITLFALTLLFTVAYASNFGSASISAVAVTGLGMGGLTPITLNVTVGSGNVMIKGPGTVEPDTLASAVTAAGYASAYLKSNMSKYNFTYVIHDNASSVSGPSGGLPLTLLAISALSHNALRQNFGATGTITSMGLVGQIGGIFEKSSAAKQAGKSFMIVPFASSGSFESLIYYIAQQTLAVPLVQVSNATQALPYAYGIAPPSPFTYNATPQSYRASLVPRSNLTCASCNITSFANLTYSMLSFERNQINAIKGNFTPVRQQLLSSLNQDLTIAQKGYLYTAADLAFSKYSTAFLLSNSNLTQSRSEAVYNNVSSYCSALSAPLMTSANYEYVVGGQLRQTWASITLNSSKNELLKASTTDDIAQGLSQIGTAYAWCLAANNMYQIASRENSSQFVNVSSSGIQNISSIVTSVQRYNSLYSQAAQVDLKARLYGAALYNAQYSLTFDNATPIGLNNSQMVIAAGQKIAISSNGGIWPFEFASQSVFYLNQALLQNGSGQINASIQTAYTISQLANRLSLANNALSGSFVAYTPANLTSSQISAQLAALKQQVSELYSVLLAVVALLFVVLIVLILLLLKKPESQAPIETKVGARARRR